MVDEKTIEELKYYRENPIVLDEPKVDKWDKLKQFIDNAIYNSWYLYNLNTVCQYEDGIAANVYENVWRKMKELEDNDE